MEERILALLEEKLKPALGCTEPIAIAYGAARAMAAGSGKEIRRISVIASGNILKNAMAVIIPGTGESGIPLAAALGALSPERGAAELEVLKGVSQERILEARALVEEGKVAVSLSPTVKLLYIEVILETEKGTLRSILEDGHTKLTYLEAEGRILLDSRIQGEKKAEKPQGEAEPVSLDQILNFADNVPLERLGIIREALRLNEKISGEGLSDHYGHEVGRTIALQMEMGLLGKDLEQYVAARTAAASDARMAGATLPVMSNSGSGNQGLTATLPILAAGEFLGKGEEEIIRAAALSSLVSIYIKKDFGVLSALCGATVAGTGAAAGLTRLLGGDREAVRRAIGNMLGNVSGIFCDGAKPGCALKVATSVKAAVMAAFLALEKKGVQGQEGIVANQAEDSIRNFCRLSRRSSLNLDNLILEIMVEKA